MKLEKCHFLVKEEIVLGHRVSRKGLKVDQAKVEVIETLPPPTNVKGLRSFPRHVGFYRGFIKDFSKIIKPLFNLLVKYVALKFDEACLEAFNRLKEKLIVSPIIASSDWSLPFHVNV